MIRIRHQAFAPGQKKASVQIMSVNDFTWLAHGIDKSRTERQHLLDVLRGFGEDEHVTIKDSDGTCHVFWVEKR